MARKHPLTEGKKNIIAALLQEYDIQSAEDIQEALKDLLGGDKIITMYARGLTTRQISAQIEDIYASA